MAIEKSITVETKDARPIREKKNKRFSYKPNTISNGHDPYPNVIPIGPIPHEKPWIFITKFYPSITHHRTFTENL